MAEAAVVNACQRELDQRGAYRINVHGTTHGRNGQPDEIAIYRRHALVIEYKTATGQLAPLQEYELQRAERAGAWVVVARSRDDLVQVLDQIDVIEDNRAQGDIT